MKTDDFHCFRLDPQVRWQGIADVLEHDPSSWDWALANIERWLGQGKVHPEPLLEWRRVLLDGRSNKESKNSLLESLRLPPVDAHQDQLRSCSPFVGGPFNERLQPA